MGQKATIYRMVMKEHICPFGLKARDLLVREGFEVDDHWLRTREQTDVFMREQGVETTPQVFIQGVRIGGHDDLRRYLGKPVRNPQEVAYQPVIAVFAVTALMASATVGKPDGFCVGSRFGIQLRSCGRSWSRATARAAIGRCGGSGNPFVN